jgi:hypothetical protein
MALGMMSGVALGGPGVLIWDKSKLQRVAAGVSKRQLQRELGLVERARALTPTGRPWLNRLLTAPQ